MTKFAKARGKESRPLLTLDLGHETWEVHRRYELPPAQDDDAPDVVVDPWWAGIDHMLERALSRPGLAAALRALMYGEHGPAVTAGRDHAVVAWFCLQVRTGHFALAVRRRPDNEAAPRARDTELPLPFDMPAAPAARRLVAGGPEAVPGATPAPEPAPDPVPGPVARQARAPGTAARAGGGPTSGAQGPGPAPPPGGGSPREGEEHWIEIELLGEDDRGIAGARYEVTLPTGRLASGSLDSDGFARIEWSGAGGTCAIRFPELDREAWSFIDSTEARAAAPPAGQTGAAP